MRIVQCISSIDVGGAENFVIDLCNELASNKSNTVHLVAFFKPSDERTQKISNNVKFHCLEKKSGLDLSLFFRLIYLILKLKPHIIHTHLRAGYYILWISIIYQKPKYFHTIHYNPQTEADNKIIAKFKRFSFKGKFITPVFLTKRLYELGSKIYGGNGIIINNGIKRSNNNKSSDIVGFFGELNNNGYKNIFVHIGRICEVKNQDLLIDTFNKLNEMGSDAYLIFIGYASESDKHLEERLHQKANNHNIKFIKENLRVNEYLRYSLGFCLTSKNEGQPISIIEAMSEGCIPVCTAVGGIPNMYTTEEGFQSELSNDAYLETINMVINLSHDEKERLADNCIRKFKRKYSIEESGKIHAEHYKNFNE